jgi:hypothetical protein
MIQEIELEAPVINPGNKIKAHSFQLRNYLVASVCEPISQLMFGLIKSDTANSSAQNSARETRNFWLGWESVKTEFSHAKEFRDSPKPMHEYSYDIIVPTRNEVMTIGNLKVKRVVQQLSHLVSVLIGLDSSNMQTWVGDSETKEIEELLLQCEKVLMTYLGTGIPKDSGYETGIEVPRYAYGQLVPDVDRNNTAIYEPSSAMPTPSTPDAADLPSIAPASGQKQS